MRRISTHLGKMIKRKEMDAKKKVALVRICSATPFSVVILLREANALY